MGKNDESLPIISEHNENEKHVTLINRKNTVKRGKVKKLSKQFSKQLKQTNVKTNKKFK